jgi:hypothetical protein
LSDWDRPWIRCFRGRAQLSAATVEKYENLKDKIESAKSDLKWDVPGIAFDFVLGFSGYPVGAMALAAGHGALIGMKYASRRYRKTTGMSYLLKVAKIRSKKK